MNKLLLLVGLVLLSGCTGTSAINSMVIDKSAKPITELHLIYIENQLTGISQNDSIVSKLEYQKLGSLLQERAPLVFGLNKIPAEVNAVRPSDLIGSDAKKINWTAHPDRVVPLLELQAINGHAVTNSAGTTNVNLNLRTTLLSAPNNFGRNDNATYLGWNI